MDTFATLAVLGRDKAERLCARLSAVGVTCRLAEVSLDHESSVMEVLVKVDNLTSAVDVLDNALDFSIDNFSDNVTGVGSDLLIPVDFSESSFLACKVGFDLAIRLRLHPVLLHAYDSQHVVPGADVKSSVHADDSRDDSKVKARKLMSAFCVRLHKEQREGAVSAIEFSTALRPGIPEEAILDYIRSFSPALVVMATRGKNKKEEELIGSVTAEVLDSCRVPVFTVPENYKYESVESIVRLALFCNIDKQDILAVDSLMKLFDYPEVDVSLIPVDDRRGFRANEKIVDICRYLTEYYRNANFEIKPLDQKSFREQLEKLIRLKDLQLLIVPNKKTNIYSRIFRPTMAHRFLFERDMPMLVLPV